MNTFFMFLLFLLVTNVYSCVGLNDPDIESLRKGINKLDKLITMKDASSAEHGFGTYYDHSFLYHPFDSQWPKSDTQPWMNPLHRFWKPNCVCREFEPIGDFAKDGYKMGCLSIVRAASANNSCLVYSLGSAGNFGYEIAVHSMFPHCEIFTFDRDDFSRQAPPFVKFIQATIGSGPGCKTVEHIMSELGHTGRQVELFKCDIEGAEWISDINKQVFNRRFKQIQLEIHSPTPDRLQMLASHSDLFCLAGMNPNVLCGECMELVFVNKNLLIQG